MNGMRSVELEEGWAIIQMGITKLFNILEGIPESPIDMELKSMIHETVYAMCTQEPPRDYSKELYKRYEGVCNSYLQSKVLPVIQEKQHGVCLLQEVVKRWAIYKVMVSKLWPYFFYLDRYHVPRHELPTLKEAGFGCFRKIVFGEELKVQVKDTVIFLINQEREGQEEETDDQTLLIKNVVEIFVELGHKDDNRNIEYYSPTIYNPYLAYYVIDFETAFLNDTAEFYTRKASNWAKEDHATKVEECLLKEKDRVTRYLHSSTEDKLLKRLQNVLLNTAQRNTLDAVHR